MIAIRFGPSLVPAVMAQPHGSTLFLSGFKQWVLKSLNGDTPPYAYPIAMRKLYAVMATHLDRSAKPVTPVAISVFYPSNYAFTPAVQGVSKPELYAVIIGSV